MSDNEDFDGEVIEDIEPYEAPPIFHHPMSSSGLQDDDGYAQDESFLPTEIAGFVAKVTAAPNDWHETLEWFKTHRTKQLIGYDPDGMCLKIQRDARNIPARYLTARESMLATPAEHRVFKVADLRRGMVAYYADPYDNNPADHIVGVIGRVKDFDPNDLNDVLMVTNSVEADKLTVVRGTYFEQHWGDDFKFGATWLNGYELDTPHGGEFVQTEENGHPVGEGGFVQTEVNGHATTKVERFHDTAPEYNLRLLARADRPKAQRILDQIEAQVRRLPDNPRLARVQEFKLQVKDDRVLDLRILDEAVKAGRVGIVQTVRNEIRKLINALPDE